MVESVEAISRVACSLSVCCAIRRRRAAVDLSTWDQVCELCMLKAGHGHARNVSAVTSMYIFFHDVRRSDKAL